MVTIQLRRGTSAEWISINPILANGEVGIELGVGIVPDKGKIGDGVTHWNDLPYSIDSIWIPLTEKGVAGGVATLDVDGFIPVAQLPGQAALDAEITAAIGAEATLREAADDLLIPLAQRGIADGVATLNAQGFVPLAQLPDQAALDAEITAAVEAEAVLREAGDDLLIPLVQKGAPDGVATLDVDGFVPLNQLPSQAALDAEITAAVEAEAVLRGAADAAMVATKQVLYLSGASGSYLSTPATPAIDITGDIDLRMGFTPDANLPSNVEFMSRYEGGNGVWDFYSYLSTSDGLCYPEFDWMDALGGFHYVGSNNGLPVPSGSSHFRVTLDVDNGAGGYDVTFWTRSSRDDPWVALTGGNWQYDDNEGPTSIKSTAVFLEVGSWRSGKFGNLPAQVEYVEIRNGINGPVVAAFDPLTVVVESPRAPNVITQGGTVWTINGAWSWLHIPMFSHDHESAMYSYDQYRLPPQVNSVYSPTPDRTQGFLVYSPIAKFIWHDLLAFNQHWSTPVFETKSAAGVWAVDTLNNDLFSQKEAQSLTIIDGVTKIAARWTWTSGNIDNSFVEWVLLNVPWTNPQASKDILIEYSYDAGVTWYPSHASTGHTEYNAAVFLDVNYSSSPMRLTITVTNAVPLVLSGIKALTCRVASQGGGAELSIPYNWDSAARFAISGTTKVAPLSGAQLLVQASAAAMVPVVIKGFASQSANLQEWQNSAGTILVKVTAAGAMTIASTLDISAGAQTLNLKAGGGDHVYIGFYARTADLATRSGYLGYGSAATTNLELVNTLVGPITLTAPQGILAKNTAVGSPAIVARGAGSQTAGVQEWQNSAAKVMAKVGPGGVFSVQPSVTTMGTPVATSTAEFQVTSDSRITLGETVAANGNPALTFYRTAAGANAGNAFRFALPGSAVAFEVQVSTSESATYGTETYIPRMKFGRSQVGSTVVTVNGMAGQTGNLQEWQNSAGTVLAKITAVGALSMERDAGSGVIQWMTAGSTRASIASDTSNNLIFYTGAGVEAFRINGGTATGTLFTNSPANAVGLTVKGAVSQTADLQQWQDSAAVVKASLAVSGAMVLGDTTALAGVLTINGGASGLDILKLERAGTGNLRINLGSGFANIYQTVGTGIKLCTAPTQLMGFWNATPVAQPAGIVDADGTLADVTTKLNSLIAKLETIGLLAVI